MKNRAEDGIPTNSLVEEKEKGTGPGSSGQSEEAELILEMEERPDGDVREVRTRQVLQDGVPLEYLNQD